MKHFPGQEPARGGLLHHQLERRQYFDSGDLALSQAHRSSNIGAVKTGGEHPLRENISHPFSPVPSASNVDEEANAQHQGAKSTGEVRHASHLHQEMSADDGNIRDRVEDAKQEQKEGVEARDSAGRSAKQ